MNSVSVYEFNADGKIRHRVYLQMALPSADRCPATRASGARSDADMTDQLSDRMDRPRMTDLDSADFFTDNQLLHDPYEYLAALRSECPVRRETYHDVVMVTGYNEAVAIYNDTDRFSSCLPSPARSLASPFRWRATMSPS